MADSSAVQNNTLTQEQNQNGSVSGGPVGKVKTQKECNCYSVYMVLTMGSREGGQEG